MKPNNNNNKGDTPKKVKKTKKPKNEQQRATKKITKQMKNEFKINQNKKAIQIDKETKKSEKISKKEVNNNNNKVKNDKIIIKNDTPNAVSYKLLFKSNEQQKQSTKQRQLQQDQIEFQFSSNLNDISLIINEKINNKDNKDNNNDLDNENIKDIIQNEFNQYPSLIHISCVLTGIYGRPARNGEDDSSSLVDQQDDRFNITHLNATDKRIVQIFKSIPNLLINFGQLDIIHNQKESKYTLSNVHSLNGFIIYPEQKIDVYPNVDLITIKPMDKVDSILTTTSTTTNIPSTNNNQNNNNNNNDQISYHYRRSVIVLSTIKSNDPYFMMAVQEAIPNIVGKLINEKRETVILKLSRLLDKCLLEYDNKDQYWMNGQMQSIILNRVIKLGVKKVDKDTHNLVLGLFQILPVTVNSENIDMVINIFNQRTLELKREITIDWIKRSSFQVIQTPLKLLDVMLTIDMGDRKKEMDKELKRVINLPNCCSDDCSIHYRNTCCHFRPYINILSKWVDVINRFKLIDNFIQDDVVDIRIAELINRSMTIDIFFDIYSLYTQNHKYINHKLISKIMTILLKRIITQTSPDLQGEESFINGGFKLIHLIYSKHSKPLQQSQQSQQPQELQGEEQQEQEQEQEEQEQQEQSQPQQKTTKFSLINRDIIIDVMKQILARKNLSPNMCIQVCMFACSIGDALVMDYVTKYLVSVTHHLVNLIVLSIAPRFIDAFRYTSDCNHKYIGTLSSLTNFHNMMINHFIKKGDVEYNFTNQIIKILISHPQPKTNNNNNLKTSLTTNQNNNNRYNFNIFKDLDIDKQIEFDIKLHEKVGKSKKELRIERKEASRSDIKQQKKIVKEKEDEMKIDSK